MRHALTCLTLLYCSALQAGTITGTEAGTANIEITQYVNGPQIGQTFYENIPATLTYSVLPPTNLFPNGSFNFDLDTEPFSFDTASGLISGSRFYASASAPPLAEPGHILWSLESAIGHLYSLTAEMILEASDDIAISAGYDLNTVDTTGTGDIITASFTPVPEPASIVLLSCGIAAVALFRSRRKLRSAALLILFAGIATAAQAQAPGSDLARQLRERQIIGMHTAAIPRPDGITQEDIDAKYGRDQGRAKKASASASFRARQWRRTHRAAAAAKNHPTKPTAPAPRAKTTTPSR